MATTKKLKKDRHIGIHIVMILMCVTIIYPFLVIIGSSFQTSADLAKSGYSIIPGEFTLEAYKSIFKNPTQILDAYKVTIIITVIGTLISVLLSTSIAYVMSRKTYRYRQIVSFYVFITMMFHGGLVANYLWLSGTLGLKDNIWVLILPMSVSAWNIMLLKGFMQGLPGEMLESGKIDGAKELTIFFKLVLPCSTPAVATVALFSALGFWNEWNMALIYITEDKLLPLQALLQRIIKNIEFLNSAQAIESGAAMQASNVPTVAVRMAMCIVAAGPILVIFPFFQKYFRSGITVGSVKG